MVARTVFGRLLQIITLRVLLFMQRAEEGWVIHKKPQSENRLLGLPRPRGYDNISTYLEKVGWCGFNALIDVRMQ